LGRRDENEERINFDLSGDLAIWLREMKELGYFKNNPEAVRLGLVLLRDHLCKLGAKVKE
jgi:Arc/MetJ-type ribon-helix-helix transcriptional regulator